MLTLADVTVSKSLVLPQVLAKEFGLKALVLNSEFKTIILIS